MLCIGRKKALGVDLSSQIRESMESLKNKILRFERNGVTSSPIGVVLKTNYETWGAFCVISGRFKLWKTGRPDGSVLVPLFRWRYD